MFIILVFFINKITMPTLGTTYAEHWEMGADYWVKRSFFEKPKINIIRPIVI